MNATTSTDPVLALGAELAWIGILGGIGWLLAIYCIFEARKKEGWSIWRTIDELLKATFTSITAVAAVHMSFQIAIHLPAWIASDHDSLAERVVGDVRRAAEGDDRAGVEVGLGQLEGRVDEVRSSQDDIRKRLGDISEMLASDRPQGFLGEVVQSYDSGKWTKAALQAIVDRHFSHARALSRTPRPVQLSYALANSRDAKFTVLFEPDPKTDTLRASVTDFT